MPRSEYDHLINKFYHRFLEERFKDLEISRAEAPYLHKISRLENVKMNDLIGSLPFHKSHTTRAINNLVKDGMILKETNPEDKRAYVLSITDKGKLAAEKVKRILTEWENLIDEVISDEEREVILNINKKIYHMLLNYFDEEDTINEIDV